MAKTFEELSKNYEELQKRVANLEEIVNKLKAECGFAELDEDGNITYE